MTTKEKSYVMVGIGEVLWDMLPQGRRLGGAPANFACHAGQMGNHGVIVSAVGADDDGRRIQEALRNKQVRSFISTVDYPTGTVSVDMGENGIPSYTIHENVAWDHIRLESGSLPLAAETDVLCYGSLAFRNPVSAGSLRRFIYATSPDCIRIFDVNLRQNYYDEKTVTELMAAATVLKLNDEELLVIADFLGLFGSETSLLLQLRSRYDLDLIILTKGEFGSRLFSREQGDSIREGRSVEVVDTVGAGDSFTAAVATGLCHGMALDAIHGFAANVAAHVCRYAGATPELPPFSELMLAS